MFRYLVWNKSTASRDVYDTLSRCLWVSRVFGTFPYDAKLDVSPLVLVYGFVVIAGSTVYSVYFMLNYQADGEAAMVKSLYSFQLGLMNLALFSCSLSDVSNRRKLKAFVRGLNALDQGLKSLGVVVPHRTRTHFFKLGFYFFLMLKTILAIFIFSHSPWTRKGIRSLFYIILFRIGLIVYQSSTFLLLLRLYFGAVSRCLRTAKRAHLAARLAAHQSRLSELAESLDEILSLQFLVVAGTLFAFLTINSYLLVKRTQEIFATYVFFNFRHKVETLTLQLYLSAQIYELVSSCDTVVSKAKEFNTHLYQLMIDDVTEELSNNSKLRLHISMKREVTFTACGFFTLDYTLVHSMIAAATTYLVILIQFAPPTAAPGAVPPTNSTS